MLLVIIKRCLTLKFCPFIKEGFIHNLRRERWKGKYDSFHKLKINQWIVYQKKRKEDKSMNWLLVVNQGISAISYSDMKFEVNMYI